METHVDLIGNGVSQGDLARALQNNGRFNFGLSRPFYDEKTNKSYVTVYKSGDPSDPKSYVTQQIQTNATLRPYEWRRLDEALVVAARYRLGGIQDLVDNGLTYVLGNAMGTTVLEWHDVSDGMEADVTMDGITRSRNDRPTYQQNFLPIPIIHVDYEINARELAASRNLGNPLDTTIVEQAAKRINEKLENMLFTNTTYAFGVADDRARNSIYSYINHPDRNTVKLSIPWDHSAITAKGILQDVQDMIASAVAAYHYGPYMLYVPTAFQRVLDDDYDVTAPAVLTIRERILKLSNMKGIKVVDSLPTDNVVLVQMTPDVVRLVEGMGIQNIEWQVEGNFLTKFKVVRIAVPQIRSDQNKKSGIVHMA
jgi:hypothetical protein